MQFSEIVKHVELKSKLSSVILDDREGLLVKPQDWGQVAETLKSTSKLDFNYLMCISSYDKGDNKTYGVAYNLYSTKHKHYLEVRVEVEDTVKHFLQQRGRKISPHCMGRWQ